MEEELKEKMVMEEEEEEEQECEYKHREADSCATQGSVGTGTQIVQAA